MPTVTFQHLHFEHDIKHYGTFGSPKIAKHVHFDQNSTWEREWERAWELAKDYVHVYGNVGTRGELNWERPYMEYGRDWGTSMGTMAHGWAITFANVHHLHTIFVIFINSCLRTNFHSTYVECPTAHV